MRAAESGAVSRTTHTYRQVYGRPGFTGQIRDFPTEAPIRTVRRDLEATASLDLRELPHEYGDLRLTVRRSDWSVDVELDVHVYGFEDEPTELED